MHEKKEIWRLPVQQLAASALASRDFPEATRIVVPVVALYTPLKIHQDLPPVLYEPVTCKPPCRAILNPYWWETKSVFITTFNLLLDSQIDICGKLWISPFCLFCNSFPPHYKDISNTNLPAELLTKYTTIECTPRCDHDATDGDNCECRITRWQKGMRVYIYIYIYINFNFFFQYLLCGYN